MGGLRRMISLVVAMALAAGSAVADDSALNKERFWTVGRGDADSEICMATLPTKAGPILLLQAMSGEVTLVVGSRSPMRRGKKGVITTEAYSFDFTPSYNDKSDLLIADGGLDARAQAALKLAAGLAVGVDGRTVLSAQLQDTGIENALDAVIACSKGEKGWWGEGASRP